MQPTGFLQLPAGRSVWSGHSFRLPAQIAWKSKDKKWLFTANYAYERGNNSMGKVGTELAKNTFGYSTLIESNQYGFTLAYKWNKQFQIAGAYGASSTHPVTTAAFSVSRWLMPVIQPQ